MLFLTRNRRIIQQGVDFKQIDKECHWDNFIILQGIIASIVCCLLPSFVQKLPLWSTIGFITTLVLHVGVSEPLYYWLHRRFHGNSYFLSRKYYSLHRIAFPAGTPMLLAPTSTFCIQLEMQPYWSI
ncbi:hypothetical protein ACFX2I_022691 [Malus domestica]|uniref:Uncharacterized protein n=1 Tax=Malus domestica TaxID=3750 RepID=A0A498HPQ6_MALDO|nr:hypothetical protein DVH24_015465 [Malus domestica]